ncbi:hypothetical protein BJX76DRAFT_354741 [Aspergillus varians]
MTVLSPAGWTNSTIGPLRSRRGCKTCKIRRVKCGQEKPNCVRCATTGRKCEYDGPKYGTFSSGSSVVILENELSVLPNKASRERRAFAYYSQHAAPLIGGLDADFWSTVVPRVCHTDPAVWDAVISISSFFESYKPCTPIQKYQDALAWYARAVSAVRRRIQLGSVDVFVGLISCVLFICIEALQGSTHEALRLYSQGVHLMLCLRAQIRSGTVPEVKALLLEDTIVPIFARLNILANPQNKIQLGMFLPDTEHTLAAGFPSLKAAREALFILTTETQFFQQACEEHHDTTNAFHVPQYLMDQQSTLLTNLQSWHAAFTTLVESIRMKSTVSPQETSASALLLTHHEMLVVIITTCVSRFKITTDACLSNFQTIVEQSQISLDASARPDGSQPPFTFDVNVGFPLWFTTLRCAEPTTRREALQLLRRAPRVQGFYANSVGMAFAENVMIVEEMFARSMNTGVDPLPPSSKNPLMAPDYSAGVSEGSTVPACTLLHLSISIPEEARIKPYGIFRPRDGIPPGREGDVARWNVSHDQTFLQFSRNRLDRETGNWRVVDECIPV